MWKEENWATGLAALRVSLTYSGRVTISVFIGGEREDSAEPTSDLNWPAVTWLLPSLLGGLWCLLTVYGDGYVSHGNGYVSHSDGMCYMVTDMCREWGICVIWWQISVAWWRICVAKWRLCVTCVTCDKTNPNIVLREELRDSTDLCPDLSCLTTSLVGLVVRWREERRCEDTPVFSVLIMVSSKTIISPRLLAVL